MRVYIYVYTYMLCVIIYVCICITLNRTPNMDCYRVGGSTRKVPTTLQILAQGRPLSVFLSAKSSALSSRGELFQILFIL